METAFRLQDHLCFSIYACSRAISRMYQPALKKMGITYPQYLVLLVLWEKGTCSVKQLGDILHLDSGTLTPLLKRMEDKELIDRRRQDQDERVVAVRLTEKGADVRQEAVCIPKLLLTSSGMSVEDVQELNRTLKILMDHVGHFTSESD